MPIVLTLTALFGISLILVLSGVTPPFTEDTARAVNVVHVVETNGRDAEKGEPNSYVCLFSTTPGKLANEIKHIDEGFICGKDKVIDFVTFSVDYGCLTYDDARGGWSESDIPILKVDSDIKGEERITQVSWDTKASVRWSLAVNKDEIDDFIIKGNSEELVPFGNKSSVDGWHIIQFSGGKDSPRKFELTLVWGKKSGPSTGNMNRQTEAQRPLLKLRADVDRLTPKTEKILSKLPAWCSLFGKSTSPFTLAFLSSLPIDI